MITVATTTIRRIMPSTIRSGLHSEIRVHRSFISWTRSSTAMRNISRRDLPSRTSASNRPSRALITESAVTENCCRTRTVFSRHDG